MTNEMERLLPKARYPGHASVPVLRQQLRGVSMHLEPRGMGRIQGKTRPQLIKACRHVDDQLERQKKERQRWKQAAKERGKGPIQLLPLEIKEMIVDALVHDTDWKRGFPSQNIARRLIPCGNIDRDFHRLVSQHVFETFKFSRRSVTAYRGKLIWEGIKPYVRSLRIAADMPYTDVLDAVTTDVPESLEELIYHGSVPGQQSVLLDSLVRWAPQGQPCHLTSLVMDNLKVVGIARDMATAVSQMTALQILRMSRIYLAGPMTELLDALPRLPQLSSIEITGTGHFYVLRNEIPDSSFEYQVLGTEEGLFPKLSRFVIQGFDFGHPLVDYVLSRAGPALREVDITGSATRGHSRTNAMWVPHGSLERTGQPHYSLGRKTGAALIGLHSVRLTDVRNITGMLLWLSASRVQDLAVMLRMGMIRTEKDIYVLHAQMTHVFPADHLFDTRTGGFPALRSFEWPSVTLDPAAQSTIAMNLLQVLPVIFQRHDTFAEDATGILRTRGCGVTRGNNSLPVANRDPSKRKKRRVRRGRDIKRARSP